MAGHTYDDDDKDTIRLLGERLFEKLAVEIEQQVDTPPPVFDFYRPGGRGHTDEAVYLKHRNAGLLNAMNALEKAARMKKGIIGKEVVAGDDGRKDIEDLLKAVLLKREDSE